MSTGVTTDRYAKKDLGLVLLLCEPSQYIKINNDEIDGTMCLYVDNIYLAGNKSMRSPPRRTLRRFDSKRRV